MKFIYFIASTMLIVLISQQSIMGLPINETLLEEKCSTGFEMIKGKCMPLEFTTKDSIIETSTLLSKMAVSEEKSVTALNTTEKVDACPDGMKHGKDGICEEIKRTETKDIKHIKDKEVNVEETTDFNENTREEVNLMNCPEGTKRDEDGACMPIIRLNSTRLAIDPKDLLPKNGSCPESYKKVGDQCLYIKTKTNSTLTGNGLTSGENVSPDFKPKSGDVDAIKYKVVPVLPDNSCPEGTEYIENGLCQTRIGTLDAADSIKIKNHCPIDSELINDKCVLKDTKMDKEFELTSTITMPGSTIVEKTIGDDELSKSSTKDPIVEKTDS